VLALYHREIRDLLRRTVRIRVWGAELEAAPPTPPETLASVNPKAIEPTLIDDLTPPPGWLSDPYKEKSSQSGPPVQRWSCEFR
jgi:hypothetical protein